MDENEIWFLFILLHILCILIFNTTNLKEEKTILAPIIKKKN